MRASSFGEPLGGAAIRFVQHSTAQSGGVLAQWASNSHRRIPSTLSRMLIACSLTS
jgi:hypothetical protein